jgi:hypothetical protein
MGKCRSNCGRSVGFLRNGLCSECLTDVKECEKGVAILRRLNPPWKYSPDRTNPDPEGSDTLWQGAWFNFTTPDGDAAQGNINYSDQWAAHDRWHLSIVVNDVHLLQREVRGDSCAWTEKLKPYFESISAVQDWKRKAAVDQREAELKNQQRARDEAALKRKYGL